MDPRRDVRDDYIKKIKYFYNIPNLKCLVLKDSFRPDLKKFQKINNYLRTLYNLLILKINQNMNILQISLIVIILFCYVY